jgi:thiamine pyrophosphate-dependent acetolactate synthase large subunit-like protein
VRFLFTLCGGHISPILVGCKRVGIRVIDVRHEATAVFAADAVARLTGTAGVAAVTAGPGVTNAITAIKNAQLAQSPVVVLGGSTATKLRGRGALQDIDHGALVAPHVKWIARARRVRDLAPLIVQAFAVARSDVPGPVFIEIPVDLLYPEEVVRDWYRTGSQSGGSIGGRVVAAYLRRHVERLFVGQDEPTHVAPGEPSIPRPDAAAVERAARRMREARRPVVLVGSQALADPSAADSVAEAVTRIEAPVYLSGMARGLLGPRHPLHMRHARKQALRDADLVLLAGVPCDFRLGYGRHIGRKAFVIAANRSRRDLRLNRRPDLGIPGDAGLLLRQLAERFGTKATARYAEWRDELRARDDARDAEILRQSEEPGEGGLNPLALCREIDSRLPDDSVLVADGGDFVATASYVIRPRAPLSWLDPGVFGTLGVGAGFALGAKLCRPESEVWALYGDGSFGYAVADVDTLARHGIAVIAVVGNDACWTQIARDQVTLLGDDVGCPLVPADYHRAAEGLGAAGFHVADLSELPGVLHRAREAARGGRPVLVNARIGRTDFRKGSLSI